MLIHCEPHRLEVVAHINGIGTRLLELNAAAVPLVQFLGNEPLEAGVVTDNANTVALPPPGRIPTAEKNPSAGGGGGGILLRG